MEPPAITKVAFVSTPTGPRILVAGTDPGERLESVWLDLLDESGELATIDPEGDGSSEPNQLEVLSTAMDRMNGTFFFEIRASDSLAQFVQRVSATLQERTGARGEPRSASLTPLEVRGENEACDPLGFDVCIEGLVCAGEGPSRCAAPATARAQRCAAAASIAVGGRAKGTVAGAVSLWDPEDGCASADRRGRPETVVRLHVPTKTASLTIATLPDVTTFDSVLTVLDGCGAASKSLACNDDDPPPTSRVTLTNVAPGDYFVVVDSLDRKGGAFELEVSVP
jgi:hypothetical protein